MGDSSVARTLARFVVRLSLDDVPASVVTAASLLTLDTLGNALAAVPEDFGRAALLAAQRLGGPAESTVIGSATRAAAANAALANGTLAHGLDFDDTREDAIVHIGDVRIRVASGEELVEQQAHSRGGPEHPVTRAELEAKFRGNAGLVLDGGGVDELIRRVTGLRDEPELTGLTRCLVP